MKWLRETHGTVFELIRHFLARMFDSELFSTQGQWRTVAIGAFAMLVPAGLLLFGTNDQLGSITHPENASRLRHLAGLATPEPFRTAVLANELALLTALFAITGLIALLEWQSLYPSRRDYLALAGLPIRSRHIFAARFAAVLLFSTGVVVTVNVLPSVIVPLQLSSRWQQNPSYLANMAAQAASSGLTCFFVLFSLVALQGVLLNLLPGRVFARVSAYVQGALVAVLGVAFLYTWFIKDWGPADLARLPQFGWAPPVWFLGLQQQMTGASSPLLAAMARRALIASAGVAILALLMYLISYARYRSLLLESNIELLAPPARAWGAARLLGLLLVRAPRQEAILHFLMQTLSRSRLHRLMLLAYTGAAIAIMLNSSLLAGSVLTRWPGWRAALQFVALFWPLAFSAIILPGFRHILSVPVELPANWIFQITENQGRAAWMAAVERFIVVYAIVPMYLLVLPASIAVLGWRMALRTMALQLLVSLSMFEVLFYSWQQLPFTCSYVPGRRPLIAVFTGYLATLCVLIPVLCRIIAAMSQFTELFLFTFAIFGAFWIWARRRRRDGWGESQLRYVDVPGDIPDLGIKEMAYGGTAALRRTASGDAGHADLENAAERADARLWSGGVHSTDIGGRASRGGGSVVSGTAPAGVAGTARVGMGSFPEQPPCEILSADSGGTQATRGGGGPLEPHGDGHRAYYGARLSELWLRLRTLLKRRQLDRDIEEEMRFHLAMREDRCRAEGAGADEAQAAAHRQFGNVTSVKEACRNLWTFAGPETFWRDVRFGARLLRRDPGFTAAAALTLALGIGATTAIYSMCAAVLWRPLALPNLESLVVVLQALPGNPHLWQPASPPDIEDVRENSHTLESLASWQSGMANLVESGGEPVRVESARVTANFFDVLGMRPALGRVFLHDEEQPGQDREVVLSDNCWRRRFSADPHITGRTVRLNDRNYTVVGVMPPQFTFPRPWYELWVPLALTLEQRHSRSAALVDSIGRLRPGSRIEQTAGELRGLAARLAHEYPDTNQSRGFLVWPVQRYMMGDYVATQVRMLLGAALFVLLIACANVANLQFARGTARWREVAVRISLGAGRRRVVSQLITESIVLAAVGGAGGLIFAAWGLRLIKAGVPAEMRHYMAGWENIGLNASALIVTLAVAILSGIAAGLAPAWRCSRPNLTESLKEGGGSSSGRGRHFLRTALVSGEIALATLLLVGAGLVVRTFRAGLNAGHNLEPATMLTFRLSLSEYRYREDYQVAGFYSAVLEKTGALPGVRSAVAVTALPYSRHWSITAFTIEGRQAEAGDQPGAQVQAVNPEYFRTMRIPLLAGRSLAESDDANVGRVTVISSRMAKRWWPGGDSPLGKKIKLWDQPVTIVGVVGDIESSVLNREPGPTLYVPYKRSPQREMDIALRTDGDPALASAVRVAVRSIDREQPITNLNTLAELIRQEAFGLVTVAVLMGVFGAMALVLASIGVYGVVSFLVSERTHEIGIRMALGAPRASVLAIVLRRGLAAAVLGLMVGLIPAYGVARLMAAMVWGVSATDPLAFVAIPLVLGLSATLATYIPARRASRIDPVAALREE